MPSKSVRNLLNLGGIAMALCAGTLFAQTPISNTIVLHVDATDLDHRVLRAVEDIPVHAGELTLLYPEWLPGTHSPAFSAPRQLAGLKLTVAGRPIAWLRDIVDIGAFHLQIPEGVSQIHAEFEFLTPSKSESDASRVSMTADIVALSWNSVVLYPKGGPVNRIPVRASLKLTQGWDFGTALETEHANNGEIDFKPTDLDTLVDSPVLAGHYFRRIDLSRGQGPQVNLDVVGDRADDLNAGEDAINAHVFLVQQARKLYASEHYGHYDFLLSMSDTIGGVGLEHRQSSEDGVKADYLTSWKDGWSEHDLLSHEYTHSWNGKFRRPLDLTTPDFNVPMGDTLLWMYEGQTQFWGRVLAVRAGLMDAEQGRELLAQTAGRIADTPGRSWRDLQDTTNEEVLSGHNHAIWPSWQRGADYYDEMVLVWLDADTRIREASGDHRSLDDFAKAFFAIDGNSRTVHTYRFDDITSALNQVQPFDWGGFLRNRLDQHQTGALLDGITRSGWKLVYNDTMNKAVEDNNKQYEAAGFADSIGIDCDKHGKILEVRWNSPSFAAGVAPEDTVIAVNGHAYKKEFLTDAILAGEHGKDDIELLLRDGDLYRMVHIDWHGGLHQPHLERIDGKPDYLTELFAAH